MFGFVIFFYIFVALNVTNETNQTMEALTTTQPQQIAARTNDLVDRFIFEQDVRANSRKVYRNNLNQFFAWVKSEGHSLSEITRTHILDYKTQLLQSGKSTPTVSGYLGTVRIFYEWCESHKLYPNIAKGVRTPKELREFRKLPISPDQTTVLLAHFYRNRDKSASGLRDLVVINMLLGLGLRTIEITRLDVEDITYIGGESVVLIHGKGRNKKDEDLALDPHLYDLIKTYLKTRGNPSRGPLFVSTSNNSRGQRLTTHAVSSMAKAGLRAIGIDEPKITAHSLRHSLACNMIDDGHAIADVQGVLRHADIKTTMMYLATISRQERRKRAPEKALYGSMMKRLDAYMSQTAAL